VQAGELNLVGAAAELGLSCRQTQRVWRRYRTAGDAGLVHRLRGRPGPRRQASEIRTQVLAPHVGWGLWSASAPLRPPGVPHPAHREQQQSKGTLSSEF